MESFNMKESMPELNVVESQLKEYRPSTVGSVTNSDSEQDHNDLENDHEHNYYYGAGGDIKHGNSGAGNEKELEYNWSGSDEAEFEKNVEDDHSVTSDDSDGYETASDSDGYENATESDCYESPEDSNGYETVDEESDDGSQVIDEEVDNDYATVDEEVDHDTEMFDNGDGYETIGEEDVSNAVPDRVPKRGHFTKTSRGASRGRRGNWRKASYEQKTHNKENKSQKSKTGHSKSKVEVEKDEDGFYIYKNVSKEDRNRIYAELDAGIEKMKRDGTWPKELEESTSWISWIPNELLGCFAAGAVGVLLGGIYKYYRMVTRTSPPSLTSNIITDSGKYLKDVHMDVHKGGFPDWQEVVEDEWSKEF